MEMNDIETVAIYMPATGKNT